jgi:hypothetical protein
MWGGGQGNHSSPPDGFNRSLSGSNNDSADAGQVAAAAALAARMAFANAYDIGAPVAVAPAASSSYYDIYGGHPEQDDAAMLFAQRRARDLDFFHLQQQMQERQVIENEARSRLLEHAARNQIQEFERTRMEMALLAEMQQRDQEARFEVERNRIVQSESMNANALRSRPEMDADTAQLLQEQQLAEYIARQKEQSLGYESSYPSQWTSPNMNESSAVLESKPGSFPSNSKNSQIKDGKEAESLKRKESSPEDKKSYPKEEQPPKKEDPTPNKVESPKRNSASDEGVKVLVDTSSHLGIEQKNTPSQKKSSTSSKKRKNTPSKTSGAATAAGSKGKQAKKSPGASSGSKAAPSPSNLSLLLKRKSGTPTLDDTVPGITDAQYENVEALMNVFCKVPLLAEFTRPVILLHPEVGVLASINFNARHR